MDKDSLSDMKLIGPQRAPYPDSEEKIKEFAIYLNIVICWYVSLKYRDVNTEMAQITSRSHSSENSSDFT